MTIKTGLDLLCQESFSRLAGRSFGLLLNQATIDRSGRHILETGIPAPAALFGPQHGLWGQTQDNMIEWEGGRDSRLGIPVYSLYGERRTPDPEWLKGLDLFVVDLPDIGSRYYTFAWTMVLCLEACAEAGVPVLVLDRPNPLGGIASEGPEQHPDFLSFVGLRPLPIRHGLTLGEIARRFVPQSDLEVLGPEGWSREQMAWDTGLSWAMPSPNMPTPDTALVYPGACLLEGTWVSEGRGTTRPFEQFGAPWVAAFELAEELNGLQLPGVHFRPTSFLPSFHKHGGVECEGVFVCVTDRRAFRPVQTYTAALQALYMRWASSRPLGTYHPGAAGGGAWSQGEASFWKSPPYEYEMEKMPIDILWGSPELRLGIEAGRFARGWEA